MILNPRLLRYLMYFLQSFNIMIYSSKPTVTIKTSVIVVDEIYFVNMRTSLTT